MAALTVYALILCVIIANTKCDDLQVGTMINGELVYTEIVTLSSIPFITRTKNVFYNNGTNPRVIKGIAAIDLNRSKAKASITSGGVGTTFANIRLKSEKGEGLNFQIQVFV